MVQLRPEPVEVEIGAKVRSGVFAQEVQEVPGGLYPMVSRGFELDEYRMMAGWPVSVPRYDIHAKSMVSAAGESFVSRDDNTAVLTSALIRWIADDASYDTNTLTWTPHVDQTGQLPKWHTSVGYAPVLISNYEYRIKDEVFVHKALNFDSDTRNHMWADFTSSIGGSAGYTVIMVMSPNSSYGNNVDVPFNGLWCPGQETPGGDTFAEDIPADYMSVTMQGRYLYLETESTSRTRGISINPELNTNAPLYLAMVFGRPEVTFYAATGPSAIRMSRLPSGTLSTPLNDRVVLGRSTGDVLHTADMALFDLSVYADRLSGDEVMTEFGLLSKAYGGDQ